MEDTMRQIQGQFVLKTGFKNPGIALGGVSGNDYFAIDTFPIMTKIRRYQFESQNIGRIFLGQKFLIKFFD